MRVWGFRRTGGGIRGGDDAESYLWIFRMWYYRIQIKLTCSRSPAFCHPKTPSLHLHASSTAMRAQAFLPGVRVNANKRRENVRSRESFQHGKNLAFPLDTPLSSGLVGRTTSALFRFLPSSPHPHPHPLARWSTSRTDTLLQPSPIWRVATLNPQEGGEGWRW